MSSTLGNRKVCFAVETSLQRPVQPRIEMTVIGVGKEEGEGLHDGTSRIPVKLKETVEALDKPPQRLRNYSWEEERLPLVPRNDYYEAEPLGSPGGSDGVFRGLEGQ